MPPNDIPLVEPLRYSELGAKYSPRSVSLAPSLTFCELTAAARCPRGCHGLGHVVPRSAGVGSGRPGAALHRLGRVPPSEGQFQTNAQAAKIRGLATGGPSADRHPSRRASGCPCCTGHGEVDQPHRAQPVLQEPPQRHQEADGAGQGTEPAEQGGERVALKHVSLETAPYQDAAPQPCRSVLSRCLRPFFTLSDGPQVPAQPSLCEKARGQGPRGVIKVDVLS